MALLIFISYRCYRRLSRLSGKNSTAPQVEVELTELDADNKDEKQAQKMKADGMMDPQEISGEEVQPFSKELEGSEGPARHEMP